MLNQDDIDQLIAHAEAILRRSAGTHVHAVQVSDWEVQLFDDIVAVHGPLRSTLQAMERDVDYAHDLLVDVFAHLWLATPQLRERRDVLPTRYDNHSVMLAMAADADVAILRTATVHDDLAAAMAVVWLSEAIRHWLKEPPPEDTADLERLQELLQELGDEQTDPLTYTTRAEELADLLDELGQNGPDSQIEGLGAAATVAHVELSALQEIASNLGLSSAGDTRGSRTISTAESWAALQRMNQRRLQQYSELIGRFKLAAEQRGSRQSRHRMAFSDRLWDADSAELATRRHRLLRLEHLERVANSELMTYGKHVKASTGGPMILVVDESWSMSADDHLRFEDSDVPVTRMTWAKAFAAAMIHQARLDRREVVVISFAGHAQQRRWDIRDTDMLVEYLEHDFAGDTSYEQALDLALGVVESSPSMNAADIVLVTDDDRPDVPGDWLTRWSSRRAAVKPVPPRLRGVGVGVTPGLWLTKVADDVVLITDFTSTDQVARAARRH